MTKEEKKKRRNKILSAYMGADVTVRGNVVMEKGKVLNSGWLKNKIKRIRKDKCPL